MANIKAKHIRAHLEAEKKRIEDELAVSKSSQSMDERREEVPLASEKKRPLNRWNWKSA